MIRVLGLQQNFAWLVGTPGAAGDLEYGLRESFAGAQIRAKQALVGVHNSDQRDIREVMALGQHLRSDQDPCRAAVHRFESFLEKHEEEISDQFTNVLTGPRAKELFPSYQRLPSDQR